MPVVFFKICVVENFEKFTGKKPLLEPVFDKAASLQPATLSKKKLKHRCFLLNQGKFLSATFLKEHFQATASSF